MFRLYSFLNMVWFGTGGRGVLLWNLWRRSQEVKDSKQQWYGYWIEDLYTDIGYCADSFKNSIKLHVLGFLHIFQVLCEHWSTTFLCCHLLNLTISVKRLILEVISSLSLLALNCKFARTKTRGFKESHCISLIVFS